MGEDMLRVIHKLYHFSKAAQERTWRAFLAKGTFHSAQATTLPYVIERCETEKVGYRLTAQPGMGYWMEPYDIDKAAAKVKMKDDRLKK